ncbi:MAG: DNA cytosine methyltransferase, partial [Bacteroidaceae bacterium]|nr:DNA cytosine methyltransferase [Bacteroidaceae bacterium]
DIKGDEVEPVDIITFGSPCQDLSVAGKRAGLKHTENGDDETTRSGLFMEAVRIIKEMRNATNGEYPRYAIWENVPGAFSSNKGLDFRVVLEELIRVTEPTAVMPSVPKGGWAYADVYCGNGWSLAYRVLDAQYWGVPQRRRRIYLVADFGGQRAGKILFEREGLRGYFAKSGTKGETVTGNAENSVGTADCTGGCVTLEPGIAAREGGHIYEGICGTLRANMGDNQMAVAYANLVLDDQGGSQISVRTDGKTPTLRAEMHGNIPCVFDTDSIPYTLKIRSGCEGGGKGALIQDDKSATLATNNDQYLFQPVYVLASSATNAEVTDGTISPCLLARAGTGGNQTPLVAVATQQGGAEISENGICPTLTAAAGMSGNNQPWITYSIENHPADSRVNIDDSGKVQTLTSRMGTGGGNVPMVMEPVPFCKSARPRSADDATTWKDYKDPAEGVYTAYWDGSQVAGTLTANNAGGNQRMPDKDNFNCVIEADVAGVDCRNAVELTDQTNALQAVAGHSLNGNNVVRIRYIVRRLTPTECARLQGFPDKWGHPDKKTELTDEEYAFWPNVRNTHASINEKATKEYTKEQMLTWYNKLHTDSSEYKMWGNGIALPCALYVMQGIAEVPNEPRN